LISFGLKVEDFLNSFFWRLPTLCAWSPGALLQSPRQRRGGFPRRPLAQGISAKFLVFSGEWSGVNA